MSQIDWVGFDMDYTLALYRQAEMDRLSIAATVAKLVARGYPRQIAEIPYVLDFAIRGLLVDKRLGNVLKMTRFKVVRCGYHGLRELRKEELVSLYYERRIRPRNERYHWIDTLYALSEVSVFVGIIDALEAHGEKLDYERLFSDIRECIDEAHRDGTILDAVMADPGRYIERDPDLAATIHKLRSAGKRIFLLTNSRRAYTERILGYLFDGVLPDYPSYEGLFDALVVAARKPSFFEGDEPLMEHRGDALVVARAPFERGRLYEGGCLRALQEGLGVPENRVLYVGDHIYGDMLRSKKESTWRTAMIIPELPAELQAHEESRADLERAVALDDRRAELEDVIRHCSSLLREHGRRINGHSHAASASALAPLVAAEGGSSDAGAAPPPAKDAPPRGHGSARYRRTMARARTELRALEHEHAALRRRVDARFHPYWGSLFKQGSELSLFGDQVTEYACVYASKVSNLLAYSPVQYFRSRRGLMPHEV